jgi:hypothetical protein
LDTPTTRPNHPPTVVVNGHDGFEPLYITAHRGETLTLDATESFDVDGDALTYEWFQYKEAEALLPVREFPAGTTRLVCRSYPSSFQAAFGVATLDFHGTENQAALKVTMPEQTKYTVGFVTVNEHSQNFHIILRVTDNGVPALSRYKRVIVTVVE